MSFLVNSFIFGNASLAGFYATANGAGADVSDLQGVNSSGTITIPAAWGGRKARVGAGGRSSGTNASVTIAMTKGGSAFDGAGGHFGSAVTGNPGGATAHSAPIVLSTSDTFAFSGPVNNTDGSWSYIELLPSGVKGALVNRTSTFSVGTAFTTCEWNNAVYDTDSFYSAGSPTVFTIPSGGSGLYRVTLGIECTSPGTEMGLRINNGVSGNMEADSTGNPLCVMSPPLSLATSATVSADVRTQSATTMKVDANTFMSIEELSSSLKYAIARWSTNSGTLTTGSTFQAVSTNAEDVDVGGWYAGSTDNKFTVPSGVTRVRVGFFVKSTNTLGSAFGFGVFKNGSEHQLMPYSAQTNASVECLHAVSPPIECSPGDTFNFQARTAAGSMAIAAGSFVWIEEVPDVT